MSYECKKGELWIPGMGLNEEYPIPDDQELASIWTDYSSKQAYPLKSVYGVFTLPETQPTAVASIDLCEVLRETCQALHQATGVPADRNTNQYSKDTWYQHDLNGVDYERSVVTSVIQVLMTAGLIPLNKDIRDLSKIMQSWKAKDVYLVANTSTLQGCERGTIEQDFSRIGPKGLFDALVLPRNHDGNGSMTKSIALQNLLYEADINTENIPLVHIDDNLFHIDDFLGNFGHEGLRVWIPKREGNLLAPREEHVETSLEAFQAADEYFNSRVRSV